MRPIHIKDTRTLDDLVRSYLLFKDWMDDDAEHSAYYAKEIIVMQALFGTTYIKVPAILAAASYEELLACMKKRQAMLRMLTDAVHTSTDEDEIHDLLTELEKSTFRAETVYFTTLFEALRRTANSVRQDDEQESLVLDKEASLKFRVGKLASL